MMIIEIKWLVEVMVIRLDCLSGYRSSILLRVASLMLRQLLWSVSSAEERFFYTEDVVGSIPAPTTNFEELYHERKIIFSR